MQPGALGQLVALAAIAVAVRAGIWLVPMMSVRTRIIGWAALVAVGVAWAIVREWTVKERAWNGVNLTRSRRIVLVILSAITVATSTFLIVSGFPPKIPAWAAWAYSVSFLPSWYLERRWKKQARVPAART